ncbi:MAG TPA: ATP-binding protein [Gammaproteobacteria bacterium]|nr:ATP-binding protein [Gammaproteobacteria bacterium]
MHKTIIKFPWFGVLSSSSFIALLILISIPQAETVVDKSVLGFLESYTAKLIFSVFVIISFVIDFLRCKKMGRKLDERLQTQNEQIDELFRGKYALQNKVHRYSGHADKLKLFISDKLLEYIEYDEKFLHFKNIASEIRHNGVISYDRVVSILKHSLEQELPEDDRKAYQDALTSMVYLWDLLDLSTTDNISLYIANKLYECEELYFRQVLEEGQDSPFTPSFSVREAILKSLYGFVEDVNGVRSDRLIQDESFLYEDSQYRIRLDDVGEFLGNENYIVLIMENLVNNGLYYMGQKKYKNQYAKLSVRTCLENRNAVIKVYNPGPEIAGEGRDKIYQLGYSAKKTRGTQGKGLGLYFVKQIVNGYEGSIDFNNIRNNEGKYVIRVACESGTIINEIIETVISINGKPSCKNDEETITKSFKFKVNERIHNIEVSTQTSKQTHIFDRFDPSGESRFLDPEQVDRPAWFIDVKEARSSAEISFKPLDTMGVEFIIKIPTVESRLDPDYHGDDISELDESDQNYVDEDEI